MACDPHEVVTMVGGTDNGRFGLCVHYLGHHVVPASDFDGNNTEVAIDRLYIS